jgi:hypothetical protein
LPVPVRVLLGQNAARPKNGQQRGQQGQPGQQHDANADGQGDTQG